MTAAIVLWNTVYLERATQAAITSGGRAADWKTGSFGPYGCPENLSVRFFPNSAGSPISSAQGRT
nr:hypothetical protein [Klebsiella pneumoniae]